MTLVQEFESDLREMMTRHIEHQPEVLLERDGGPIGLTADIILATLYGFDGQVDAEWRIPKVEDVLLRPIPQRTTFVQAVEMTPSFRTAEYVLQSSWATMQLDWLALRDRLPKDVHPAPGTYLVTVALVRYRRRK